MRPNTWRQRIHILDIPQPNNRQRLLSTSIPQKHRICVSTHKDATDSEGHAGVSLLMVPTTPLTDSHSHAHLRREGRGEDTTADMQICYQGNATPSSVEWAPQMRDIGCMRPLVTLGGSVVLGYNAHLGSCTLAGSVSWQHKRRGLPKPLLSSTSSTPTYNVSSGLDRGDLSNNLSDGDHPSLAGTVRQHILPNRN
ncbi:hypothetical protein IEO21_01983 [Rhodonia placenta]|uniref:Uncharacterized protein n=1 Tax=Rhodonia placenta TaxID=104341 RepID=A0A8H7P8P1_9APHY|nr:hypothetical protein IEO21_01983 [Postia placenta]